MWVELKMLYNVSKECCFEKGMSFFVLSALYTLRHKQLSILTDPILVNVVHEDHLFPIVHMSIEMLYLSSDDPRYG